MDQSRIADYSAPHASALPPRLHALLIGHIALVSASVVSELELAGIMAQTAATAAAALHVRASLPQAIMVLALDRADQAGLMQIAQLSDDVALIVVLATDGDAARVACLDHGADDVVPLLAPLAELAARIRALHRRMWRLVQAAPPAQAQDGVLAVDAAHRCIVGPRGDRMALSEAEFVTLETLLDADGSPVSREWLGRIALRRPMHADDRSVDQLVLKLRRKLSAVGGAERTILSARRQGYVIADPSRFRSFTPATPPNAAAGTMI